MGRTPPLLERIGTRALLRWSAARPVAGPQLVHLLDEDERAAMRRIERLALLRAATAGALSALAAGLTEAAVRPWEESDPVLFWGAVGGVSALAAVGEIAFLSWDSLRSAHRLSLAAGLVLDETQERQQTLAILARAALEVPSPPDAVAGINPLKETQRWRLLLAGLAYKLKVSATNLIFKQLLRRALGRAAVRAWLQFVSIPVTAAWNAFACARVLRELRVRVFGASLAADVVRRLLPGDSLVEPLLAEALLRAVGACVVRSADPHPNLARLFEALERRTGASRPLHLDDPKRFLTSVAALPPELRVTALRLLRAAVVCDGRIARRERELLAEAAAAAALTHDERELEGERRRVLAGEALALA
ncbi:MAG: hypothetical protein IT382_18930 [Deltaproteobacteria bacterium]|nr:hypothetical protein [Deltaproteobacteria bacterium]